MKYFLIILIILFISCEEEYSTEIYVQNNTENPITVYLEYSSEVVDKINLSSFEEVYLLNKPLGTIKVSTKSNWNNNGISYIYSEFTLYAYDTKLLKYD